MLNGCRGFIMIKVFPFGLLFSTPLSLRINHFQILQLFFIGTLSIFQNNLFILLFLDFLNFYTLSIKFYYGSCIFSFIIPTFPIIQAIFSQFFLYQVLFTKYLAFNNYHVNICHTSINSYQFLL